MKNPGRGAKYEIPRAKLPEIRRGLAAFLKAREEAKAARQAEAQPAEQPKSE